MSSITPEMIQAVARVIAGSRYWNCSDKTEVGVLARQALEAALESVPAKAERLFVDEGTRPFNPGPQKEPGSTAKDLTATNDEFAPMLAELKRPFLKISSCLGYLAVDDPMLARARIEPEAESILRNHCITESVLRNSDAYYQMSNSVAGGNNKSLEVPEATGSVNVHVVSGDGADPMFKHLTDVMLERLKA